MEKDRYFDAVVIGGCTVDLVGRSYEQLRLYDSNPGNISYNCGGVGRNITENLIRMGLKVLFISIVGNDSNGQLILQNLSTITSDTQGIFIEENSRTATFMSILNSKNDMLCAIANMEINKQLTSEKIQQFSEELEKTNYIILEGNLNQDLIEEISNKYKGKICFDSVSCKKCEKIMNSLKYLKFIKPNLSEASILIKKDIKTNDEIKQALLQFQSQGIEISIISLGKEGIAYLDSDSKMVILKTNNTIEIKNCIGAGDAFFSGFIFSQAKGYSLKECCLTGIASAQITIESEQSVNPQMSSSLIESFRNKIDNYLILDLY